MTEQERTRLDAHPKLDELIGVMERLRAPDGCAWDREQTHESLVRYLVEECYELIDAIEAGSRDELIEEFGDVLYQVLFHSDIAAHSADEAFTIEDVAEHMTAKMIGRHPHVFGDAQAKTAADVVAVWDHLKRVEKPTRTSVLDGVPQGMPALALADKLLGKAETLGVEIAVPDAIAVAEAAGALDVGTETQLGEVLLALVSEARRRGVDAERALRTTLRSLQDDIRAAEKRVG